MFIFFYKLNEENKYLITARLRSIDLQCGTPYCINAVGLSAGIHGAQLCGFISLYKLFEESNYKSIN